MKQIETDVLPRIEEALRAAAEVLTSYASRSLDVGFKQGDEHPVVADSCLARCAHCGLG
jgi:hypothetical protein